MKSAASSFVNDFQRPSHARIAYLFSKENYSKTVIKIFLNQNI